PVFDRLNAVGRRGVVHDDGRPIEAVEIGSHRVEARPQVPARVEVDEDDRDAGNHRGHGRRPGAWPQLPARQPFRCRENTVEANYRISRYRRRTGTWCLPQISRTLASFDPLMLGELRRTSSIENLPSMSTTSSTHPRTGTPRIRRAR